jgi:predicted phosphohydrolase
MAIYTIGDLHLSFQNPKPMNIFGENWDNHEEKIKEDWLSKVKPEDTVIHPGDFSWAMYLKDTIKDFEYLNSLPGKKIMLKGNHEYWWTTLTNMKNFLDENGFKDIEFLQNNCFEVEDKIICGTRGWSLVNEKTESTKKIIDREALRLELSIKSALDKRQDKEIIVFMHYPPIVSQNLNTEFMKVLKKYDIKRCYYAHLHSKSIREAVEGIIEGIEFKLVSADSLDFKLLKIE